MCGNSSPEREGGHVVSSAEADSVVVLVVLALCGDAFAQRRLQLHEPETTVFPARAERPGPSRHNGQGLARESWRRRSTWWACRWRYRWHSGMQAPLRSRLCSLGAAGASSLVIPSWSAPTPELLPEAASPLPGGAPRAPGSECGSVQEPAAASARFRRGQSTLASSPSPGASSPLTFTREGGIAMQEHPWKGWR